MTQVSKRLLGKELEQKVYETFWETIVKINKKDDASAFFGEFFSRNEKINFTKRLSIAALLHKGYDWRSISNILKVSLATIGKMASKMDSGGFRSFFEKVDREESWRSFWKDLAKTYIAITHPDKFARLGREGVDVVYFRKKKRTLL